MVENKRDNSVINVPVVVLLASYSSSPSRLLLQVVLDGHFSEIFKTVLMVEWIHHLSRLISRIILRSRRRRNHNQHRSTEASVHRWLLQSASPFSWSPPFSSDCDLCWTTRNFVNQPEKGGHSFHIQLNPANVSLHLLALTHSRHSWLDVLVLLLNFTRRGSFARHSFPLVVPSLFVTPPSPGCLPRSTAKSKSRRQDKTSRSKRRRSRTRKYWKCT